MCRQSLLCYLETTSGNTKPSPASARWTSRETSREKGNWCAQNAQAIATLLENGKIFDPAIGSGTFPIGMLNEITSVKVELISRP